MNVLKKLKRAVRRLLERRERRRLFGELAQFVPPVEEMFDGTASLQEFHDNGLEFLEIYKRVCGLRDDERMLDVGSGIGRKTIPLTQFFSSAATYDGIDINERGVRWCRERITPAYPQFRFQHIDVVNSMYNPAGRQSPSDYGFPFAEGAFTFVNLTSVFTHMMPRDVEHYLSEVRRVLRGRCLISYFLLNDESRSMIESGRSTLPFKLTNDVYATIAPDLPERAIAYDERFVRDLYARAGLNIVRVDYGSWCGRERFLSYQDLIVAE